MNLPPSTSEILAYKALGRLTEKGWLDWAYDMLIAGYETEYLLILAGMEQPLEHFEMRTLTDKVLAELKLDYSDTDKVITSFACYLANQSLKGEVESFEVLETLKDIHVELDLYSPLSYFYDLYYAKVDLLESEDQWYIDDVDRSNIDSVINDHLQEWASRV